MTAVTWDLPPLGVLIADDPWWRYPSPFCAAGDGIAHLRVWDTPAGGHVAVVTEAGLGASVTNSAEGIIGALQARYGHPLTLLEHWPDGETITWPVGAPTVLGEHIDQVHTGLFRPRWRRVWPVHPDNPDYDALAAWFGEHGRRVAGSEAPW